MENDIENNTPAFLLDAVADNPQVKKCVRCEQHAELVGTFVADPEFQKKVLAPKGKTRIIVYGACLKCVEDKEFVNFVEEKCLSWAAQQN